MRGNPKDEKSGGVSDGRRPRNERRGIRVRDESKSEKNGGVKRSYFGQ